MILALDLGNSNIVVGGIDEKTGESFFEDRIHTDREKTAEEYAILLKSLFDVHGIKASDFDGGILSSSVPPVTRHVRSAAELLLKKEVIEVGPGLKTGVDIKIDDPASLGPDLLVGAVAGISEYGAPLLIVDMGTATTVSIISDERKFVGGIIMPGVKVSLKGLTASAAHLPEIAIEVPKKFINGDTVACMQTGSIYGTAFAIDGMIERLWEELGYKTAVVATGGFAKVIVPCCTHKDIIAVDNELLIKGLRILYNKNKK